MIKRLEDADDKIIIVGGETMSNLDLIA